VKNQARNQKPDPRGKQIFLHIQQGVGALWMSAMLP